MKHWEYTGETMVHLGVTLKRIRLAIDCQWGTKGTLGGWIEKDSNLQENAWVSDNAKVYGNAWVSDNAKVYGNAWVYGDAQVCGNAWVYGNAQVYGYAKVYGDAQVCGNAKVYVNARICGESGDIKKEEIKVDTKQLSFYLMDKFNTHIFIDTVIDQNNAYIVDISMKCSTGCIVNIQYSVDKDGFNKWVESINVIKYIKNL